MGSTHYRGREVSEENIFVQRVFLAGDLLSGIGYGMQFILYISCALYLWNARKSRGKQSTYLLIYITLLLGVETIFVAVQAHAIQLINVDYRNYPGGPCLYLFSNEHPLMSTFYSTLFVLTFLSDLLVLWRCWIIWGGSGTFVSYSVVAFPFLMVLASFAVGILWTLHVVHPGLFLYGTIYYVVSVSINILLTILIAARLLAYRRKAMSILHPGHAARYFSLAAIFVESAGLYSIFALVYIIFYTLENPVNQIFLVVASSAQQIAGYLIIYRLAVGRAWNQRTSASNEGKLQTLNFQSTFEGAAAIASTNLDAPPDGTSFALPYSREDLPIHITAEEKKDDEDVSVYTSAW